MTENVRSGKCAYNLAFGKPIFEDLLGKPEDATIFDAAMNSFHGGETEAVLDAYSYEDIGVLADIGCGAGAVVMATLKRYPAMRGMLFDCVSPSLLLYRLSPAPGADGLSGGRPAVGRAVSPGGFACPRGQTEVRPTKRRDESRRGTQECVRHSGP